MKKIGLFFGTFNPIHLGHMKLAHYFVSQTEVEEVWLIVTPRNPFKSNEVLLDDFYRLEMVKRACEPHAQLYSSDIEFDLPRPNYSIDTLRALNEKYTDLEFVLLIGEDNLASFHHWKGHESILKNFGLRVYPRQHLGTIQERFIKHPNIRFVDAPKMNISASNIREQIKSGRDVSALLPIENGLYLQKNNFYR